MSIMEDPELKSLKEKVYDFRQGRILVPARVGVEVA